MKYTDPHRWRIIVAIGMVLVLCLFFSKRLRLDEKITGMLPDSDPVVSQYTFVVESFRILDAVYVDIEAASNAPESLKGAMVVADFLYRRFKDSGLFSSISYRTPKESFLSLIDLLSSKTACLLSSFDLQMLSEQLEEDRINHALTTAKRRLLEPSGLFMRDKLRRDPLEIDGLVYQKLETLRTESAGAQIKDGIIWSADSKHILMMAAPDFPAVDTQRGEKLVEFLNLTRSEALEKFPAANVVISFAGTHIATHDNASTIKSDVARAMLVLSLGILLLGILVFRNRIFVVLIFLPAVFGLTVASAFFGLVDPFISAIALGCGTVLVGIAVDYAGFVLYHLDNTTELEPDPGKVVRSLLLPLFLGACTTIAGFMGLTVSSLPGQRQMGLFASLGVLVTVLFVIFALKYFLPANYVKDRKPIIPLASLCSRFLEWRASHSRVFLFGGMLVLVICLYGLTKVRFEGDVTTLNRLSPEVQRDSDRFLEIWGNFSPTLVAVRGKTLDEALEANDRLYATLLELQRKGTLGEFSSIAPILPSPLLQQENLAKWKAFWSPERRAAIRSTLTHASVEHGFSSGVFDPFYESIDRRPSPITLQDYEGTALDQLIKVKIATNSSGSSVLSSFLLTDRSMLDAVSKRIAEVVPGAVVMDKRYFVEHMTSLIGGDFNKLVLVACLAIAFCLYLFLLRLELVLVNMIPVGLSVVVTLGMLGLLGIDINLMSILFVVFIFGVGVDFSVFLMSSELDKYKGMADRNALSYGAVIICGCTSMGGFMSLVFARHAALFSIGATGVIAMLASIGTALTITPGLTGLLLPREGRYGTPSLKTLGGAVWAFVYLAGMAQLYSWCLRFPVMLWYGRDLEARSRFARHYMHFVVKGLLKTFPYLDSKRISIDVEAEQLKRPGVIVSNHLSAFDIMLILALPTEMVMIVKRWVWKAPIIGRLVRDAGYILTEEGNSDEILARSREYLEKGVSVMVFPEGSRSPDGRMRRFYVGAFLLAIETGSDVIPVLLSNSQACIPYKSFWIGDHQTVTRVLPRISKDDDDHGREARAFSKSVRQKMLAHVPGDWRMAQDGKSFWHNIRSLYNYRGAYVESYITWKLRLDPIYRRIDALVPAAATVLDIGSGYGLMSAILAKKSLLRQVIGIDFDPRKVLISQKIAVGCHNLEFRLEDFLNCDLPAADVTVMIDVLHYWPEARQLGAITRACSVLDDGGVLIFREACQSSSLDHALVRLGEGLSVVSGHNRGGTQLHFMSRDFYLEAFAERGLKLIAEPQNMGRGSNVVFVLRKET